MPTIYVPPTERGIDFTYTEENTSAFNYIWFDLFFSGVEGATATKFVLNYSDQHPVVTT